MAGKARTVERPERAASMKVSATEADQEAKMSAAKGKVVYTDVAHAVWSWVGRTLGGQEGSAA
jgi:hypothetical protein